MSEPAKKVKVNWLFFASIKQKFNPCFHFRPFYSRIGTKSAVGTGVVATFYQAGLWKNSEETIKNYEIQKKNLNGFIDSTPVLVDILSDISRFASNAVSPATEVQGC